MRRGILWRRMVMAVVALVLWGVGVGAAAAAVPLFDYYYDDVTRFETFILTEAGLL